MSLISAGSISLDSTFKLPASCFLPYLIVQSKTAPNYKKTMTSLSIKILAVYNRNLKPNITKRRWLLFWLRFCHFTIDFIIPKLQKRQWPLFRLRCCQFRIEFISPKKLQKRGRPCFRFLWLFSCLECRGQSPVFLLHTHTAILITFLTKRIL